MRPLAAVSAAPPGGRLRLAGAADLRRALAAIWPPRATARPPPRLGLGDTELLVIANLAVRGELTPTTLGRRVERSSGASSALLHRLDADGWLTRRAHPTDRRS